VFEFGRNFAVRCGASEPVVTGRELLQWESNMAAIEIEEFNFDDQVRKEVNAELLLGLRVEDIDQFGHDHFRGNLRACEAR
jgi:hypothetical protein